MSRTVLPSFMSQTDLRKATRGSSHHVTLAVTQEDVKSRLDVCLANRLDQSKVLVKVGQHDP
jgi:hypothetical protein